MGCLLWLAITYCFGLSLYASSEAWPVDYIQPEDPDYPPAYGQDNGDISDWMAQEEPDNSPLPSLSVEEMREIVKMMEKTGGGPLPYANFSPVGPDPTNNGGAGPFKFVKPTPPPVVQTRAAPVPMKKHIATISDETPLYLNYAEKEDGGPHRPPGLQQQQSQAKSEDPAKSDADPADKTLLLLPEVNNKPSILTMLLEEEAARQSQSQADDDAAESDGAPGGESQVENGVVNRPEIDFTQRLAFPDLSGTDVQPVRLTEVEQAEENAEEAEVAEEKSNEDTTDETEEPTATDESETEQDREKLNPIPVQPVTPALPLPADIASNPLVVHVVGAPAPQHLAVPNDVSFIPSPEYGLLLNLKAVGDKRAQMPTGPGANSATGGIVLPIVFACLGAVAVACVGAALLHRRNSRKQTYSDAEEPAYGVTGPGPIKPTFLDLSGDRSLAKSAETYHYQHQKRQILSSVENNPSSGGSTATPRSGDHSDYDSDEDEEEGEDYGDYTVYECPGLAPPGEIEVLNPMFSGAAAGTAKDSPSKANQE